HHLRGAPRRSHAPPGAGEHGRATARPGGGVMDRKLLCAPFPRELIRSRPGSHGKTITYVPASAVIARLNAACESWSFTILEHHEFEGTEDVVRGRLEIAGVVKCALGGSAITKDREGSIVAVGDDLKAAASDALKKAASLFGVPIDAGRAEQAA